MNKIIPPLNCSAEEFKSFCNSLEIGERVIELGDSCMTGQTGTIVEGREGKAVKWDTDFDGRQMTTAITAGTRRIQINYGKSNKK